MFCSCLFVKAATQNHSIALLFSLFLILHPSLCVALWPLSFAALCFLTFSASDKPSCLLPSFCFHSRFYRFHRSLPHARFPRSSFHDLLLRSSIYLSVLFLLTFLLLPSTCAPRHPLPSRLVSPITVQRVGARVSLCPLTWARWAKRRTSPAQPRGGEPPALPR